MYVFCILSRTCVHGLDQFDVGLAYNEPDHCFIHKWLLLTDPEDSSSSAKVGGAREGEGSGGHGHAQGVWNFAVRGAATGTNLSVPLPPPAANLVTQGIRIVWVVYCGSGSNVIGGVCM